MALFSGKLWFGHLGMAAGMAALFGAACSGDDVSATAQPGSGSGGSGTDAAAGGKTQSTGGSAGRGTTDAAVDAAMPGSFVIAAGGETRTITFPDGAFLKFVFPSSAAGKRVSLQIVDDATLGLDGKFPHLVEMLPHGTTFDPPVLVTPDWSKEVPVLKTFADASGATKPDVLHIATDLAAFELPHFSYISVEGITFACPFGGSNVRGISTLCKATQNEQEFYCDDTQTCRAIRAHCCVDIVGNLGSACTELVDYKETPINFYPCGNVPRDAGRDAPPDVAPSGQGGAGGAGQGGAGGSGQSGSGGVGPSSGCPKIGYYTVTPAGVCGDLNSSAPKQRLDGRDPCLRYWEFDGSTSLGVSSGALPYNSSGPTTGLSITLGSLQYNCTATVNGDVVTLDCDTATGAPQTCTLTLGYTGPLI